MTNEELPIDLKQFITETVSQQMVNVATTGSIRELRAEIRALDERLALVEDAISDTFNPSNDATDAKLRDHERRLRHCTVLILRLLSDKRHSAVDSGMSDPEHQGSAPVTG